MDHFPLYGGIYQVFILKTSVMDPDPSINKQKKVRKTLISTILRLLFDFLSMKAGTDPRIRIHTNMSRIHNTAKSSRKSVSLIFAEPPCNGSALDRFENKFCNVHVKYLFFSTPILSKWKEANITCFSQSYTRNCATPPPPHFFLVYSMPVIDENFYTKLS
jgi:hypothetical protein